MQPRELVPLALEPPLQVSLVSDPSDSRFWSFLYSTPEYGWDIETDMHHDFYWRRVRTIQVGTQNEQYVVDLLALCDGDPDLLRTCQGDYGKNLYLAPKLQQFIAMIEPSLCGRDSLKIGVNLGFEYLTFYWCFGLRTQHFFDCSIVERCIQAGNHSLKDYGYYGMEEMMGRYFGVQIDKTLQTSFTLDQLLTQEQIEYAALDTRLPFGIKKMQSVIIKGERILPHIDPLVQGDNLERVCQLENDAIGAFQDMHCHGERLDKDKWNARVSLKKQALEALFRNKLDPIFVPLVGSKSEQVTQEEVDELHTAWKALSDDFKHPEETRYKAAIAMGRRIDPAATAVLRTQLAALVAARKQEKDRLKAIWSEKSQHLTVVRNLADDCEGDALINYDSGAQLLKVLNEHFPEIRKRLGKVRATGEYKKLESLEEEVLDDLADFPVMAALKEYHKLSKEINTYGDAWTMMWIGHDRPSKEAGWLHPGDGRLHCMFNQYEAETGRSSSSQPNAQNLPKDKELRSCFIADDPDGDAPEGYVLVTADMSGAELRILAELAGDPVWIGAFARGEDVHCICCELMDPEGWRSQALDNCAYFTNNAHKKCKCPLHDETRNGMKPTNFGLPYGIGPGGLMIQINENKPREKHKTLTEVRMLMHKHEETFPIIWEYLEQSGINAISRGKSFDMFGRRRLFPKPEWERARLNAMEYKEEALRYPEAIQERNISNFILHHKRKPNPEEKWRLKHRLPTDAEIKDARNAMFSGIERQGKNHEIQGTNASIAKVAMGSGYCPNGIPYLWHTLQQYSARLVKFVHDELVVQCPKRYGEVVAALVGDAFKRAAAEVMTKVSMEFEYHIETYWCK